MSSSRLLERSGTVSDHRTLAARSPRMNWDGIKPISPGTEVRVERSGTPSFGGELQRVTEDDALMNTLIGMGAVAGLGVRLATTRKGYVNDGLMKAVTGVLTTGGAPGRAIVGTVIPTSGWWLIYKR